VFYKQPYQQQIVNTYGSLDFIKEEKNATIVLTIPSYFKEYYFKKYKRRFEFINFDSFNEKPSPKTFRSFVTHQNTDYFICGNLPLEYIQIVKEKYSYLLNTEKGFTYSTYCFSKLKPITQIKENIIFSNQSKLSNIDSNNEYGAVKTIVLKDVIYDRHTVFNVSAMMYSPDTASNPILVADISANEKSVVWNGAAYFNYNNSKTSYNNVFFCYDFTSFDFNKYPNAEMKIYIWNRHKKQIKADQLRIEAIEGNHYLYGLYEPLD
jgi:hypothetical protein